MTGRRVSELLARREYRYWALSGLALFAAAVIVVVATTKDPAVRVLRSTTTRPATTVPPVTTTPGLGRSVPRELVVPSLGIATAVGQLGLRADHTVQVPSSVHTVGWFRLGPTPGQVGSAVILGHVDSYLGPGIFFELKTLALGALIEVRRADGLTALFRVTRVVQYAKTNFPDALVYGAHSGHYLNLVTCGGTFNHATGSYESNIVVFSRLVGVRPTHVA